MSGEITPEQLRARLEAAGLSMEDVRGLLREAGYPPELLDAYLEGGAGALGATGFTPAQIESVLRRLGVPPLDPLAAVDERWGLCR